MATHARNLWALTDGAITPSSRARYRRLMARPRPVTRCLSTVTVDWIRRCRSMPPIPAMLSSLCPVWSDYSGTVTHRLYRPIGCGTDWIGRNLLYQPVKSQQWNDCLCNDGVDPAGNTITVDPTAMLGDGSAGAPAGTPELPNLLNGYASIPQWEVAGVDYAVGVPTGTALKDPSTISMAGVSVNTTTRVVDITGSNITLNGYDFSLHGGYVIYIGGNCGKHND